MIVVGVDENGLGPLLGPLVTTAVTIELARYSPERHGALGRELGIDDSKATSGFGQMALAEGVALALVEERLGREVSDVDALLDGVLLDKPAALRKPCPAGSLAQCWATPLALPCFGGDRQAGRETLKKLQRSLRIVHLRSAVSCAGDLNRRLARGQSRVEVDLELMERLVLDARAQLAGDLRAICGMVGGIRNYPEKMRHLPRKGLTPVRAQGGTLAYEVTDVGHVRFEIDADARHLPVALASMVGKYVRELWMARQNHFYRERDPSLQEVSGYHDPITQAFIGATLLLRRKLGVDDACFTRKSQRMLIDEANAQQLALL
jgi:ribonuclease HII